MSLCQKFNTLDYDMQLLCRPFKSLRPRSLFVTCGMVLGLLSAASWASESSHEQLFRQVREWEALNRHQPAEQIDIAALDTRVQVQTCPRELQLDHPFVSQETVRVRCPAEGGRSGQNRPPVWQLYLQINNTPAPSMAVAPPERPVAPPPPAAPRPVLVAKQLLVRGVRIDPSMLQESMQAVVGVDNQLLTNARDLELAEVTRDIPAGSLLHTYDVKRSVLVKQGQSALLSISTPGAFQVTVQAEAQQDGYLGDQIRLKNAESGRIFYGVVIGPNALRGL
jgi:flagella basal body P-ring formation protein FlgA